MEGIAPGIGVVLVSSKSFNKRICKKKKFMKVYATIFILFHRLSCTHSSSSSSSSSSSCSSSSVVVVVVVVSKISVVVVVVVVVIVVVV